MKRWMIILALALMFFAAPAARADDPAVSAFLSRIQVLNHTGFERNPGFKTWQQMFSMRVIDKNSQLVGRVGDIKVDETGALTGLVSDLTRVGRYNKTIETPSYDLSFRKEVSAFQIPLLLDGAQDNSPEALAAITPAAGGGKILSLKAMKGAEVRNTQGRWVGEVTDVLFDDTGANINALVIQNVPGAGHYKQLAIPYDNDVLSVNNDYGRIEFRLTNAAALAVTGFARDNR